MLRFGFCFGEGVSLINSTWFEPIGPVCTTLSKSHAAVFVALCIIWGSTWLVIKVGLDYFPPFLFAGARFAVASLFLLCLFPFLHAKFPRDAYSWGIMALLGVLQIALTYGLLFWGEQYTSSGVAAVLSATFPFFVIFGSALIKIESITRRKLGGIVVAFIGVGLMFWRPLLPGQGSEGMSLLGGLAIVGSAASTGVGTVIVKQCSSRIHPATNTLVQSTVGAAALFFVGLATERYGMFAGLSVNALAAVLYLGVMGSALAYVCWYWLISETTATTGSLILLITPVIAVLLGWLVLQEELGSVAAVGTILILSGVYVTLKDETAKGHSNARRS